MRILITSEAKEYLPPTTIAVSKINMFDSPMRAPGKKSGGNKLSSIKARVASAVKIAVKVAL